MVDITTIPTEELLKDLEESRDDIFICNAALLAGITRYSVGLVVDRIRSNRHFIEVITLELERRNAPNPISSLT